MNTTEVTLRSVDKNLFRLDAEHHVGITELETQLLCGDKLSDLCSRIVQGPNPQFVESGIPSLNGKNIYFGSLDAGEPNYVSCDGYDSFPSFHLKKNDILITLKHASRVGRLWIFRKDSPCMFSRNLGLIRVKRDSKISPIALLFYLWGEMPQKLLNLIATGGTNGQITLSMSELRPFPVPRIDETLQEALSKLFLKSELFLHEASEVYSAAENALLTELGLQSWHAKHQLSFVGSSSSALKNLRLDAEYYQPKHDLLNNLLSGYPNGSEEAKDLLIINDSGYTPKDGVTYKYIELADIGGCGVVATCTEREGQDLPTRARRRVNTGDLIISSVEGSLSSIALINEDFDNALCSTGFHIVRSENVNSETLLTYFKCSIGQSQLKRGCSGTILAAISKEEFKKIVLPKFDMKIQQEVKIKVNRSFDLRNWSKLLLKQGTKSIELATAHGSKYALEWLKSHDVETPI
jgi:restriction endonuclease S subunit